MKGIILYQSKYGAARRYAEWAAESTGFDCMEIKQIDTALLAQYDTVIFGGGVYASRIAGLNNLKKHAEALKGKKLAVFCCGAAPVSAQNTENLRKINLQGALADVPLYPFRGAFPLDRMTIPDRAICRMLYLAVTKKAPDALDPLEQTILTAAQTPADWTDRLALQPLLEWARQ